MYLEAKTAWMSLFNEEVAKVWSTEMTKLQNLAAVFHVFKSEFNSVGAMVEKEMQDFRQRILASNDLENNKPKGDKVTSGTECKKNMISGIQHSTNNKDKSNTIEKAKALLETSPKISRSKKMLHKKIAKLSFRADRPATKTSPVSENESDLNKAILESSIIDVTPNASSYKKQRSHKSSVTGKYSPRRKTRVLASKNNTLTQMMTSIADANNAKSKDKMDDETINKSKVLSDDETYIEERLIEKRTDLKRKNSNVQFTKKENFKEITNNQTIDMTNLLSSDETYVEEKPIDKRTNLKRKNSDLQPTKTSNMVLKTSASPNFVYKIDPVRGKARKKLQGWSCQDCQKFYEAMDLPEDQLREKMNQCSRHRDKFKPPPNTPSMLWEIDIPSSDESEKSENDSIIFNFKNK